VSTKSFLTLIVVLFQLPGDGIGFNGFSGLQVSAVEFTHEQAMEEDHNSWL